MGTNPLNAKDQRKFANATNLGPSPAAFPVGSPQSRAAARAMLSRRKPSLTAYDRDCLTIYRELSVMGYQVAPSSWDLKGNAVYEHGQALSFKLHPIVPSHLRQDSSTLASREFELAFGREPQKCDLLRYEHLVVMHDPKILEAECHIFTEAWKRRLPDLPCPKKFEHGHVFERTLHRLWTEKRNEIRWVEDTSDTAAAIWKNMLSTIADDLDQRLDSAAVFGVTFLGIGPVKRSCGPWAPIIENQHRARPSTREELEKPDPEPKDGLLKTLREFGMYKLRGEL